MLGRFGWKAGEPTLNEQSSHAMAGDVGIGNPIAPAAWGDCTAAQTACRAAPMVTVRSTTTSRHPRRSWTRSCSTPAIWPCRSAAADDPTVLRGKQLFYQAGCIGCHVPKLATRRDWEVPALAGQLIWPYTDLLLHDMGEGLADHRPEGMADGREWRTPPLWGIGLTETVNGHTYFLHDGRARSLTEAILWHGGEAQAARDAFTAMSKADRDAMLAFLNSL